MCKIAIRNAGMNQDDIARVLNVSHMVLRDGITGPHFTRIIEEYKNQQNIASVPRPSLLPHLNPIEHLWDKLG